VSIAEITPVSPVDHPALVKIVGDRLVLNGLVVEHLEAVEVTRRYLSDNGDVATADLVRRALPIGLLAVTSGTAAIDTGALGRTLDGFAEQVDAKSQEALNRLDAALNQLRSGEQAVAETARQVLGQLPAQVDTALAGQAANVRQAVTEAARAVQATGLQQVTAALGEHSRGMRDALSLDREGPVASLKADLLGELTTARQEITAQLTHLRASVEAEHARKQAAAKSSRAVGAEWEATALAMAEQVVLAAGDYWQATGGTPGAGTTRRSGDGLATLGPAISSHEEVRIAVEAKRRSRALSMKELRAEVRQVRQVRQAAAVIILVPTVGEVPGNGRLCRVDDFGYAVAADEETVSLVYLIVRELVALLTIKQSNDSEIDLAQVEAKFRLALSAMEEFDEVGRLATQARRSLDKLLEVGKGAQNKARQALTEGVALLRP
jgi:HJR/Mrr/RecB family endonuclease